jgi:hypothetical protein
MSDDAVATRNDPPGAGWAGETLEQRVQRLEDAVASLQNTGPLEERITQRVAERLEGRAVLSPSGRKDQIIEAPRSPMPAAPKPTGLSSGPGSSPLSNPVLLRQRWLLFDVLAELAAIFRMFFDVRYHVGWSARLIVLVLVPLILLSHWWLPLVGVPVVGPILDKVVSLFLAFVLYKALSREARRYMELKGQRRSW